VNSCTIVPELSDSSVNYFAMVDCVYRGYPGIGYHAINWIEACNSGTAKFFGSDSTLGQSGIHGEFFG
jgi:hypothetical protein